MLAEVSKRRLRCAGPGLEERERWNEKYVSGWKTSHDIVKAHLKDTPTMKVTMSSFLYKADSSSFLAYSSASATYKF
jgi:hypothetical protein